MFFDKNMTIINFGFFVEKSTVLKLKNHVACKNLPSLPFEKGSEDSEMLVRI